MLNVDYMYRRYANVQLGFFVYFDIAVKFVNKDLPLLKKIMENKTDDAGDVNELLAEETEEEKQFNLHVGHKHPRMLHADLGMVHSATTDTLDSVYLEPPAPEQEVDIADINLGASNENISEIQEDSIVEPEQQNTSEPVADKQEDEIEFFVDSGDENRPKDSPPSLSKYFGKTEDANDPFADIVTVNDEEDEIIQHKDEKRSEHDTKEEISKEEETVDQMLDLTLNDSQEVKDETSPVDSSGDNYNNNYRLNEDPTVESVDFDLALDAIEKVETPVDIEEKDTFESFTADLADTETLDALGMSPAAPSYMTERNMKDYFRQTSQADSVTSLKLGRQLSQASNRSSGSLEHTSSPFGSARTDDHSSHTSPRDRSGSGTMTATDTKVTSKQVLPEEIEKQAHETTSHQPLFPPSTTLSPVDSPVHQPSLGAGQQPSAAPAEDHQRSPPGSFPPTPEHKLTGFQTFSDSMGLEDPFSASLQMCDSDRQHDAWIPSESTKNILITMATHAPGSFVPDSEMLCMPLLVITEPQGDPVRDLVYRYMGEQEALKRQVLTSDKVTQDFDGIKQLMKAGCYRAGIDLTGKLLVDMGHGVESDTPVTHSPESLQLWYCRFSLLMKLRLYSIVESEFMAFQNLDTPDIYYEYYPHIYPGKRGSMVPFGMRLVHAELPHHLGRSQESLDRLFYMLAISKKVLKNLNDGLSEDGSAVTISAESRQASESLWIEREKQVQYSIGNILVSLRDYDAALSVYESLLEKDPTHKIALLSGIGRIHLQIGNYSKASEYFKLVNAESGADETQATGMLLMNRGFEAMCQNNFQEAYQNFKSAVQADPLNTSAINNMAVCCLYLGRLKDALKALESLVHSKPDRNLHEGILFNLCTLYELESSRALHKKQALLDLVSKHKGDGFPVVCLKMQ